MVSVRPRFPADNADNARRPRQRPRYYPTCKAQASVMEMTTRPSKRFPTSSPSLRLSTNQRNHWLPLLSAISRKQPPDRHLRATVAASKATCDRLALTRRRVGRATSPDTAPPTAPTRPRTQALPVRPLDHRRHPKHLVASQTAGTPRLGRGKTSATHAQSTGPRSASALVAPGELTITCSNARTTRAAVTAKRRPTSRASATDFSTASCKISSHVGLICQYTNYRGDRPRARQQMPRKRWRHALQC